jgi:alginate O-acetyltransferase complex protein AlgI
MLFNSLTFLFGYLPATLVGFYLLARFHHRLAAMWLAAASIFFYAWWNTAFVGLLTGSVVFNFGAGYLVARETQKPGWNLGRVFLTAAISGDLALLGYFKYVDFFARSFDTAFGLPTTVWDVTLPLGISFFTFTQIAYLVDSFQGKVKERDFLRYLLFVTYFPHLIAGPIIHHKQVMPQFAERSTYRLDWTNFAHGLTFVVVGLGKKVLVADTFGLVAKQIFDLASNGGHVKFATGWAGALAYTLQLYFDFSGYSDMAVGLSLMFNVELPFNFNSPYKAGSIIEFWRRWHMTLAIFLRDYLYIPLGGNRRTKLRRYANLFVTMLLGGLWHGAGWTFVVWGALHGVYLIVNHGFRAMKARLGWPESRFGTVGKVASVALTFGCTVVGWVVFRADSIATAFSMIESMFTGCYFAKCDSFPEFDFPTSIDPLIGVALCVAAGLVAVWTLPNSQGFILGEGVGDRVGRWWPARARWTPLTWWYWLPLGLVAAFAVITIASNPLSQFLYYQF